MIYYSMNQENIPNTLPIKDNIQYIHTYEYIIITHFMMSCKRYSE